MVRLKRTAPRLSHGDIIENPSFDIWKSRLSAKDNQGDAVAKDFSKDSRKSQQAYAEEVEGSMPFAERVKAHLQKLDADAKKKFVVDMVAATGTKKVNEMNKDQQKKVLALMK